MALNERYVEVTTKYGKCPSFAVCPAEGGTYPGIIFYMDAPGYRTELDLRNLLMTRIYLTGSTLRPRTVNQKAEIALELEQKVWPLVESGKIKPVIHSTFPLSQASDAHQLMEEGSHIGKILLIPKT